MCMTLWYCTAYFIYIKLPVAQDVGRDSTKTKCEVKIQGNHIHRNQAKDITRASNQKPIKYNNKRKITIHVK